MSGRVWDPPLRRMTKTVSRLRRGRSQTGPRAAKGRPYGGNGPVALARQSQAQFLNRTIRNFPSNRPPKAAPNAKPSVAGLRWRGHSPAGERFGAQPPEGRLLARRWSDGVSELCPVRAKRGIRNPRRRSGPAGIQTSRSDFARRKCCKIQQVRVPRNGVRGKRSYGPRRSEAEP